MRWWKQLIVNVLGIAIAYFVATSVATGSGPGSDRYIYLWLVAIAFVFVVVGPRFTRYFLAIPCAILFILCIQEWKEAGEYSGWMQERHRAEAASAPGSEEGAASEAGTAQEDAGGEIDGDE